jgi:hypothetical protein
MTDNYRHSQTLADTRRQSQTITDNHRQSQTITRQPGTFCSFSACCSARDSTPARADLPRSSRSGSWLAGELSRARNLDPISSSRHLSPNHLSTHDTSRAGTVESTPAIQPRKHPPHPIFLEHNHDRSAIMVADALIYHPTVAHYLKFVATTGASAQSHPILLNPPNPD